MFPPTTKYNTKKSGPKVALFIFLNPFQYYLAGLIVKGPTNVFLYPYISVTVIFRVVSLKYFLFIIKNLNL